MTNDQEYFEKELEYTIDPYKVYSEIQQQQDIVIVDVRSIQDYVQGHIPTAISLPN